MVGEVLLRERRIEDAIAVAEGAPYEDRLVERVADAAIQLHPDWVIRTCQQAEWRADSAREPVVRLWSDGRVHRRSMALTDHGRGALRTFVRIGGRPCQDRSLRCSVGMER